MAIWYRLWSFDTSFFYVLVCLYQEKSGIPCFEMRCDQQSTSAIYGAGAVKIYNAVSSLVRFENKTFSSTLIKLSSLLQRWRSI
jgi:hypothetical protein